MTPLQVVVDGITRCLRSMGERATSVDFDAAFDIKDDMSMIGHVEAVLQAHCEVFHCLRAHNHGIGFG